MIGPAGFSVHVRWQWSNHFVFQGRPGFFQKISFFKRLAGTQE